MNFDKSKGQLDNFRLDRLGVEKATFGSWYKPQTGKEISPSTCTRAFLISTGFVTGAVKSGIAGILLSKVMPQRAASLQG